MFRIGFKLPCNGLNRVKRHGYSTIYLTTRKYETRARIKCEPEGRLCKDVKLMSRFSGPKYSTGSPKSEKSRGSGGLVALGALTLGTIGILTYAKQDPEFRKSLEEWVPGSKGAIEIIFQEEDNYFQFLTDFFKSINQTVSDFISSEEPKKEEKPAKLDPPKPALEPLIAKKEPPIKKPHTEIRISNDRGKDVQVVPVIEKPAPPPQDIPADLLPANLVELEHHSGQAASRAISAYKKASSAIEDYNKDVVKIVEGNGDTIGENVWERLKDATQKRKEALRGAEEHAKDAVDSLKKLYASLDDPKFQAPELTKTIAKQNIRKIVDDVDHAKEQFENQVKSANVTERYWKQVAKARKTFEDELEILFPNVNIADKKLSVDEESFDLFVLHMYNKVNYLQQELEKLQTIDEMKINAALRSVGDENERAKIDALVSTESSKAKLALYNEFSKKILAEKRRFEDEMRTQLKLQAQIHSDHLRDALQQKQRETERIVNRALSERAEAESSKYKLQLASVVGRVQGLEAALKARMEEDKSASNAQLLWSACQALARAVKVAPHGVTGNEAVRPLQPEITAISKAAPASDPLVTAVINGIPKEASQRGVFTEDVLRERFVKVENMARRLALVPEGGAALPIYLLSYLQSFLLVKAISPIPKAELADEPIDPEELGTYDVLQRARYWLDRGDFKMTLRYLNLLKGASRSVATQWMNEARVLLETQQAVDTLVAYAGAAGLVFLGGGDTAGKRPVSK